MKNEPLTLFHSDMDGFAAACVIAKRLNGAGEYRAVQYGDAVPDDIDGRVVYLVDFTFSDPRAGDPSEQMRDILDRVERLHWMDHHVSIEPVWDAICASGHLRLSEQSAFGEDDSGATLAWAVLSAPEPTPPVLQYVRDRDLWLWELDDSRAVSAGLKVRWPSPWNPSRDWESFLSQKTPNVAHVGGILLDDQESRIKAAVRRAHTMTIDGHMVAATNAASDQSEIGQALCQGTLPRGAPTGFDPLEVALIYWYDASARDGKGGWIHSLRSASVNVAEIAKARGGGGHKAAAGFVAPAPPVREQG